MSEKKPSNICIVSFPLGKAFTIPISNLSTIFSHIVNTNVIIGSYYPILISEKKSLKVHNILYRFGSSKFLQIIRYSSLNIKIILKLFSLRQMDGCIIFFMESCPILPMSFSLLFGKKTYWMLPSNIPRVSHSLLSRLEMFLSYIGYRVSTGIIVYSPNLIIEWNMRPYRHKILIARHHFINTSIFSITTPFSDRPPLIGYIGRFSWEKGIQNFIRSLPAIFKARENFSVFIGGEGHMKERIALFLQEQGLTARVVLLDWILHDDLPFHLNNLQLLVIPSYTEGLPNIMLDAMACGTPVLATSVGAIPDIIKDGETGFIMENNSPECIAENINRALNDPNLKNIIINAKIMVEREFTFEITVKQWKRIFDTMN